jgi:hypothetical protein
MAPNSFMDLELAVPDATAPGRSGSIPNPDEDDDSHQCLI